MRLYRASLDTEHGPFTFFVDGVGHLVRIDLPGCVEKVPEGAEIRDEPARVAHVLAQIEEYLAGSRRRFELELAPRGTPFQLDVWRALCEIPYGETRTYGELAACLGRSAGAARAVGRASATNPIPVVIPCHRLVGAGGSLTGFGGGLELKAWLLELEGAIPPRLF